MQRDLSNKTDPTAERAREILTDHSIFRRYYPSAQNETLCDAIAQALRTIRAETIEEAAKVARKETEEFMKRRRCRDCADDGPICPNDGKPCDPREYVAAAIRALGAQP